MYKNNVTKIFFLVAFMILSTSIGLAEHVPTVLEQHDANLAELTRGSISNGIPTHAPSISIDPELVGANAETDFKITVKNEETGVESIEEVRITKPDDYSGLSCGDAPAGWILEAATSLYCRYIANQGSRIVPGGSQDFIVRAKTASEDGESIWEIVTWDIKVHIITNVTTTVDGTAPSIETYDITYELFSPNLDGVKDTTEIDLKFSEQDVKYEINILDSNGDVVRELASGTAENPNPKVWDGTNNDGVVLADGVYTIEVALKDGAGNTFTDREKSVTIDATVPTMDSANAVTTTRIDIFFSEDLDDATLNPNEFSLSGSHTIVEVTELNGVITLILGESIGSRDDLEVTFTPKESLADLAGNKVAEGTIVVTNELPAFDLIITLDEGWNLISVPKMLKDSDLDAVLGGLEYDAIATYDGAGWILPASIEPLRAYWIKVSGDKIVYIEYLVCTDGPNCVPASRGLGEGWQLVGFTGTVPMLSDSALSSIQGRYSQWFGFLDGNWISHIIFDRPDKNMEPTLGYWIFMTKPGTIAAVSL